MNAANWIIPATINPRAPSGLGGGAEPLPGQGPCCHGVPQRGHWSLEEPTVPTGHRFLGVLQAGGCLGSFLTAPQLPQTTDVVAGPAGTSPPILVGLFPGIRQTDVQYDRHPRATKFCI